MDDMDRAWILGDHVARSLVAVDILSASAMFDGTSDSEHEFRSESFHRISLEPARLRASIPAIASLSRATKGEPS